MGLSSLNDDLLKDFKEQKELIYKQIALFDPLGTRLRLPAAQHLMSKGALIFAEIFCYLLSLATIAFAAFLNKLYPFYILSEIRFNTEYAKLGRVNMFYLTVGVYAMAVIIALLCYILARCVRHLRRKNDILQFAGKQIKELVGQHLKRKASIDAIEQRHFVELPGLPYEQPGVNDVPNPGF